MLFQNKISPVFVISVFLLSPILSFASASRRVHPNRDEIRHVENEHVIAVFDEEEYIEPRLAETAIDEHLYPEVNEEDGGDCVICADADSVICHLRCGHSCMCEGCFRSLIDTKLKERTWDNVRRTWIYPAMPCPMCRKSVLPFRKFDRPISGPSHPCLNPKCRKIHGSARLATVFHDSCGRLVACEDCGKKQMRFCPSCMKRTGCLKKIYYPDD